MRRVFRGSLSVVFRRLPLYSLVFLVSSAWAKPKEGRLLTILSGSTAPQVQVCSDGKGGIFAAWFALSKSSMPVVIAQRLDFRGNPRWGPGVPVSSQDRPKEALQVMALKGDMGILWRESINGMWEVFMQTLDHHGRPQGSAEVVLPSRGEVDREPPVVAEDGEGGFLLTWAEASRSSKASEKTWLQRVQKFNARGKPLWLPEGILLGLAAPSGRGDRGAVISPLENGKSVTAWLQRHENTETIQAQKLDRKGKPVWKSAGIPVVTSEESLWPVGLNVADDGSSILTWRKISRAPEGLPMDSFPMTWAGPVSGGRGPLAADLMAQRIDAIGNTLWPPPGALLAREANDQANAAAVADIAGGVFVAWEDVRGGAHRLYLQHVDPKGLPAWGPGVQLAEAAGDQRDAALFASRSGGVICVWRDSRFGRWDLYAQKAGSDSAFVWESGGLSLDEGGLVWGVPKLVSGAASGAVVIWLRQVLEGVWQVRAQRIASKGEGIW